jgi:uncharacterized membrane protein
MNALPGDKHPDNIFLRLRPIHRLFIGLAAMLLTWILVHRIVFNPIVMTMVLWDAFCVAVLTSTWIVIFSCSPARIRKIAGREDGSRLFVFIFVLVSSIASMATVLFLVLSKGGSPDRGIYIAVAIGGMLLSWIMVHTIFCFHYANMYYGNDDQQPQMHAGGLEFPKEKAPDYLDFAYFSFVIGMTFQVSDVVITSREIRRQVLIHGLLAFALNTFVVALTVNLIAGLKGS